MVLRQDAYAYLPRLTRTCQGETDSSLNRHPSFASPTTCQVRSRLIHLMLQTATSQSAFVANVLSVCLTRFVHPRHSTPRQIARRRPGGKLCVGRSTPHASLPTDSARAPSCRSAALYDATTYTQFATWAA